MLHLGMYNCVAVVGRMGINLYMARTIKALSTFYKVRGSLDQRIRVSTELESERALLDRIKTKKTRDTVDLLMQTVCNQNCSHCHFVEEGYHGDLKIDSHLLADMQTIVDFFNQAKGNRPQISTYPRELSLVPSLLPFRQQVGHDSIYTNASVITPFVIDKLIKHGVKNAFVSLHGDKGHHVALTGVSPHQYERTLKGIELLHGAGITVTVLMTIYKDNLNNVSEVVKYLEDVGIKKLKLVRYFPAGRGKDLPVDKILSAKDVLQLLYTVDNLRKQHPKMNISLYGLSFGPNFYSPNYFRYLAGQKEALSGDGNVFGSVSPEPRYVCALIGRQYLGISLATHYIYPCFEALSFPELRMGKLIKGRNGINLKLDEHAFAVEQLSENLRGQCSKENCTYQKLCLGGCRMHAYAIAKQRNEPDPLYAGQDVCVTRILDKELTVLK